MPTRPSKRPALRRPRIRLAPQARIEQILESALTEFSQQGFVATRIEDIARGAGLSKSGFYAHFQSKEDVFQTLLTRYLISAEVVAFDANDTVEAFVDRFIELCYSRLTDPRRQAILRLLLGEAHRIPELVNLWRRDFAEPMISAQLAVLRAAVARGQLADSAILQDFSFVYSPVLYWVLANGPHAQRDVLSDKNLAQHREIHRQMLLALLRAPGRD